MSDQTEVESLKNQVKELQEQLNRIENKLKNAANAMRVHSLPSTWNDNDISRISDALKSLASELSH